MCTVEEIERNLIKPSNSMLLEDLERKLIPVSSTSLQAFLKSAICVMLKSLNQYHLILFISIRLIISKVPNFDRNSYFIQ